MKYILLLALSLVHVGVFAIDTPSSTELDSILKTVADANPIQNTGTFGGGNSGSANDTTTFGGGTGNDTTTFGGNTGNDTTTFGGGTSGGNTGTLGGGSGTPTSQKPSGFVTPDIGKPELSVGGIVSWFIKILNYLVVAMLVAALIVFLYGVFTLMLVGGANEESRSKGKKFMMWGIVSLFVMVSVWGLVNVLRNSFFGTGPLVGPQFNI